MKYLIPVFLLFYACNTQTPQAPSAPQPPKALQEKDDLISYKKRGDGNLLDKLYDDVKQQDSALKALDRQIHELADRKADSLENFEKFDSRVKSYYRIARTYANNIADSTIKLQLQELVKSSLTSYSRRSASHTQLLKSIKAREQLLNDLHVLLKVIKTLPLIEQYQEYYLPSAKPLQEIEQLYDGTIEKVKKAAH